MIARLAIAALIASAATAAAEPLAIELSELAPPLGPGHLRVSTDAAFATGRPTTAASTSAAASVRGARGKWMLSTDLGVMAWRDQSIVLGVREVRGVTLTNLTAGAARWIALGPTSQLYIEGRLTLPTTSKITRPAPSLFSYSYDVYLPSQYVRLGAAPTVGASIVPKLTIGMRFTPGRLVMQAEAGIDLGYAWLAAGLAVPVSPDLALTAHALGRVDVDVEYDRHDDQAAIGAGAIARAGRGRISLHGDYRLDTCDLGDWGALGGGSHCTRVVLDYAIPFR